MSCFSYAEIIHPAIFETKPQNNVLFFLFHTLSSRIYGMIRGNTPIMTHGNCLCKYPENRLL